MELFLTRDDATDAKPTFRRRRAPSHPFSAAATGEIVLGTNGTGIDRFATFSRRADGTWGREEEAEHEARVDSDALLVGGEKVIVGFAWRNVAASLKSYRPGRGGETDELSFAAPRGATLWWIPAASDPRDEDWATEAAFVPTAPGGSELP